MDFQEGSQVGDQSMVVFPFHLNWWSTWGLHQALQIAQHSNSWVFCQLRSCETHEDGLPTSTHDQWGDCLSTPAVDAVEGENEQQKKLPKPPESNAATLLASGRSKCVLKHCVCIRMLLWLKVCVLKETPLILGLLCCDAQPGKTAEENVDSQVSFREIGTPFTSCLFSDQNLWFLSEQSPASWTLPPRMFQPKCTFLIWLEFFSFYLKLLLPCILFQSQQQRQVSFNTIFLFISDNFFYFLTDMTNLTKSQFQA